MSSRIDSFRQLLNEISHELNDKNLQSLVHLCNLPGAMQSTIKDGHHLFKCLIHEGKISADDVGYLRALLRKMRPRRKYLVDKVDTYIKEKHNVDDVSQVLGDLSDSMHSDRQSPIPSETGNSLGNQPSPLFQLDCAYMNCACRRFPSCSIPLIVLTVIAVVCTALFWYADVPKVSEQIESNSDLKRAGAYIIVAECILLLLLVGFVAWQRYNSVRYGYRHFVNSSIQVQSGRKTEVTVTEGKPMVERSEPRKYNISTSTSNYGSYSGAESASRYSYASGAENFSTDEAS